MKKIFPVILVAFVLANFSTSYSQVSLTLNAGVEIPIRNFSNTVSNGYGLSASAGYSIPLIPVEIALSAGYDNWPYKLHPGPSNSNIIIYSIPVTLGPKLFINIPGLGFEPYIGIEAGVVYSNSTLPNSSSTSDFIYTPAIGFRYNLPLSIIAIDINVKDSNYKNTSNNQTISWFSINGGITLSL
ncbi:MAG: outer membrane beta-barrel protein [Ignavibacteriaceae bacterium]|jgi:hypothetical protein